LNFQRDRPDYSTAANLPDKERHKINLLPIEQAAQIEWQRYKDTDNSIIRDVFVGMTVTVNNCQSCPYVSKKFDPWYMVQLKFPDECHVAKGTNSNSTPRKQITLEELLAHTWDNEEKIDDYTCETCHVKGDLIRRDRFAVLPEYLVLYFPRFETEGGDIIGTAGRTRYQAHKCRTIINFPERGIDLTRYWLDNNIGKSPKEAPSELKPPFLYECYAAISHSGTTTQGGHYIALARSPDKNNLGSSKGAGPGDWHSFSDVSINNFSFHHLMSQEVVVLFLRRQKN
jgi:ubiquitin carboxyl-terminal hydrolase 8